MSLRRGTLVLVPGAMTGAAMPPRFEARQDEDGSWAVYDRSTDLPAVVNDVPQLGHSEVDARAVARSLEDLMGDEEDT